MMDQSGSRWCGRQKVYGLSWILAVPAQDISLCIVTYARFVFSKHAMGSFRD